MTKITAKTKSGFKVEAEIYNDAGIIKFKDEDLTLRFLDHKWALFMTVKKFATYGDSETLQKIKEAGLSDEDNVALVIMDNIQKIKEQFRNEYQEKLLQERIDKLNSEKLFTNIRLSKVYRTGRDECSEIGQHIYIDEFHFVIRNIFDFGTVVNRHKEDGYYTVIKNKLYFFNGEKNIELLEREEKAEKMARTLTDVGFGIRM